MMSDLRWQSLEVRRAVSRPTLMYKILSTASWMFRTDSGQEWACHQTTHRTASLEECPSTQELLQIIILPRVEPFSLHNRRERARRKKLSFLYFFAACALALRAHPTLERLLCRLGIIYVLVLGMLHLLDASSPPLSKTKTLMTQ